MTRDQLKKGEELVNKIDRLTHLLSIKPDVVGVLDMLSGHATDAVRLRAVKILQADLRRQRARLIREFKWL